MTTILCMDVLCGFAGDETNPGFLARAGGAPPARKLRRSTSAPEPTEAQPKAKRRLVQTRRLVLVLEGKHMGTSSDMG